MSIKINRHSVWIKIISTVIVCLFSVNSISVSQNVKTSFDHLITDSTLAPYLLFRQKLVLLSGLVGGEILQYDRANPGLNVFVIGGYSGSGKTTAVEEIKKYLEAQGKKNVVIVTHDWFSREQHDVEKVLQSYSSKDEKFTREIELFYWDRYVKLLKDIDDFKRSDQDRIEIPLNGLYIRETGSHEGTQNLSLDKDTIVMVDASLGITSEIEDFIDYSFFFTTTPEEQIKRIQNREKTKPIDERISDDILAKRVKLQDRPCGDSNKALNLRRYDRLVENTDVPRIRVVKTVQRYGLEFTYADEKLASVNKIVGAEKNEVWGALIASARQADNVETVNTIISCIDETLLFSDKEKQQIIAEVIAASPMRYELTEVETTREPGTFGYIDIIRNAEYLAKYSENELSRDVFTAIAEGTSAIQRPEDYAKRPLNDEEKRIFNTYFLESLKPHFGKPWWGEKAPDISLLILHNYLYYLFNSFSGYHENGIDVCQERNYQETQNAIDAWSERESPDSSDPDEQFKEIVELLKNIYRGNKHEGTRETTEEEIIIASDYTKEAAKVILSIGPDGILDIFIDNAGPELVADLQLIDYLVKNEIVGKVRVHIKPDPFGISDVWGKADNPAEPYFTNTLEQFKQSGNIALENAANSLEVAIANGKVGFKRDEFLIYTPDYAQAKKALHDTLIGSKCAIFVGENHCRKLLSDRRWAHTPNADVLNDLLRYVGVPVVIVRTIKSDMIVGMPVDTSSANNAAAVQIAGIGLKEKFNLWDIDYVTGYDNVVSEIEKDIKLDDSGKKRLHAFYDQYIKILDRFEALDDIYVSEAFSAARIADMFYLSEIYGFDILSLAGDEYKTEWKKEIDGEIIHYKFKGAEIYVSQGGRDQLIAFATMQKFKLQDINYKGLNLGNFAIKILYFLSWANHQRLDSVIFTDPMGGKRLPEYYLTIGADPTVEDDGFGRRLEEVIYLFYGGLDAGILTHQEKERIKGLDKRIWRVWSQRKLDRYFKLTQDLSIEELVERNESFSELHKKDDIHDLRNISPETIAAFINGDSEEYSVYKEVKKFREVIPQEYYRSNINQELLSDALYEVGGLQIAPAKIDEKTAFIFSEKVTFDNGLGVLLPKLVESGLKIAVIAKNDRERQLIDQLNRIELAGEENKIIYADNVLEATSRVKGAARFYYFKLENDSEESIPANVNLIDSLVVRQIIEAIGKASGLDIGMIEKLREAARRFAIAA